MVERRAYIKRRNCALSMIQQSIKHSDLGKYFTITDATSKEALPDGVAARLTSLRGSSH